MTANRNLCLLTISLLLGLASAAARADNDGASPTDAPVPTSALTRAEVLADLEVWRRAGLADASRGEAGPDVFGAAYQTALATYHSMRAAPEFAQRVMHIARAGVGR